MSVILPKRSRDWKTTTASQPNRKEKLWIQFRKPISLTNFIKCSKGRTLILTSDLHKHMHECTYENIYKCVYVLWCVYGVVSGEEPGWSWREVEGEYHQISWYTCMKLSENK